MFTMFDAPPDPQTPEPQAPAAPVSTGARERMGLLRRMSEIGLRMAERLDRSSELSAFYAEAEAVPENLHGPNARRLDEIARAFAPLSRAVSLSVALEERIERAPPLAVRPAPEAEPQAIPAREPRPPSRLGARREAAERAMRREIDAAHNDTDPARAARLHADLDRLIAQELAAVDAFLDRPFDEVLARIRRGLGLVGDASQAQREDEGLRPKAPHLSGPRAPRASMSASLRCAGPPSPAGEAPVAPRRSSA